MSKKKIYICGKITGIEKEAERLFDIAEKELLAKGYIVVNPMRLPHNHDKRIGSYMRVDIRELTYCDAIYILKNFKTSKNAATEISVALSCEMELIFQN